MKKRPAAVASGPFCTRRCMREGQSTHRRPPHEAADPGATFSLYENRTGLTLGGGGADCRSCEKQPQLQHPGVSPTLGTGLLRVGQSPGGGGAGPLTADSNRVPGWASTTIPWLWVRSATVVEDWWQADASRPTGQAHTTPKTQNAPREGTPRWWEGCGPALWSWGDVLDTQGNPGGTLACPEVGHPS